MIAHILQRDRGLLPYSGYRVRTLHGLAHDIIRERPTLAGLPEDFSIIDERTSLEIVRGIVHSHLDPFEDQLVGLIDPEFLENPTATKSHQIARVTRFDARYLSQVYQARKRQSSWTR